MALSAFDLYSIGIGPSSSHTVGPMRAAARFARELDEVTGPEPAVRVQCELFGSLGATGHGHGTPAAVMLGLEGAEPDSIDVDSVGERVERIRRDKYLRAPSGRELMFDHEIDLVLHRRRTLAAHSNAMTFRALNSTGVVVSERTFYSVGGGFIVEADSEGEIPDVADDTVVPHPFGTADELLEVCRTTSQSISDVVRANERCWRADDEIDDGLLNIWSVMKGCVDAGCANEGMLPGIFGVKRRAPRLHAQLSNCSDDDPLHVVDWVNLFALAVNEENAAGGRVVTAPTNGAAGIIPAVLHYYMRFVPGADEAGVVRFLLTATAIGILFKQNASISGAEVGCQGEVGSACAMAAGALCELLGGSPEQVENAAEIGIEHNLGLTCDPVGGLVQIPCIERNAIASVKAINAARLAMNGDGNHRVSLDDAIRTMRDTGRDMHVKYKETSSGGLAVNVVEC